MKIPLFIYFNILLFVAGDDDDMGIIKRGRFISSSSEGGSFPLLHGSHRKLLLRSGKTK